MVEDCGDLTSSPPFEAEQTIRYMDAAVEEVFTCMLRAVCTTTESECDEECIRAAIRLHGDPAGECSVEVPVSAGDRLTDALLGTEVDWDEEMLRDAVGELCNMITGGVKRRLGLWCDGCRISLPVVIRRPAGQPTAPGFGCIRRVYVLDNYRVTVNLWLCTSRRAAA